MNLMELLRERKTELASADAVLARAEKEKRPLTEAENSLFDEHMNRIKTKLNPEIDRIESANTIAQFDRVGLLSGRLVKPGQPDPNEAAPFSHVEQLHPKAAALNGRFIDWARTVAGSLAPTKMTAEDPSGIISIGAGAGMVPANFAVPLEVLPFEPSYVRFSPFERAGARVISTDHMRDVNLPVLAAGAPPDSYGEGQGPAAGAEGSKPFGLSGFTFKSYKRSRQVIADWESLMSTEVPMQPLILDELLASIANVQTEVATLALYNALTAPPDVVIPEGTLPPLMIGGSGADMGTYIEGDIYSRMTALRHALVDGLEASTNCWMLSRATLAIIRNTRANTSGMVMFDPESDLILGRPYITNEFFDSICGAGFIAYGNWNRGAFLRRTPLLTRVLSELYALSNEIGFLVTQWADNHFLAELVGATHPPNWQPIYCTRLDVSSGS